MAAWLAAYNALHKPHKPHTNAHRHAIAALDLSASLAAMKSARRMHVFVFLVGN